jgi:hypothetical protein
MESNGEEQRVRIPTGPVTLEGTPSRPHGARRGGAVRHGSGSSRHSPRNRHVARLLAEAKLATLLADLLTPDEEPSTRAARPALRHPPPHRPPAGRHRLGPAAPPARESSRSATSGAAPAPPRRWWRRPSALASCARWFRGAGVRTWRGRRWTGSGPRRCSSSAAPTRLVVELNRQALARLRCDKRLAIVRAATHLFEEPGALDEVARLAPESFERHLAGHVPRRRSPDGAMTAPAGDRSSR